MTSTNDMPPIEAYSGSESYLFVSYSHMDSQLVFPEIRYLHEQGYRIWYDEGIDPGNEWPDMVAKALKGATQFLVFVSNQAVTSKNVRNEINFALNHNKPFVAVHIEETALPTGLELRMGDIQAILRYRLDIARYHKQLERALKQNVRSQDNLGTIISSRQPDDNNLLFPESNSSIQLPSVIINDGSPLLSDSRLTEEETIHLAHQIAIYGTDIAMKGTKFARFGDMDVADPKEIDGYIEIRDIVIEYLKRSQRVPLSVAVFGPPNTGQLFCVQQVTLSAILVDYETCVFDLSNFRDLEEFTKALHQVREIGISGKIPLVFWEGFDANHFRWLEFFIPIMSSGSFVDNLKKYQIGNSIFAFISTKFSRFKSFTEAPLDDYVSAFDDHKGPDFVSCLRGYLNLIGLNPSIPEGELSSNQSVSNDTYFVIRRSVWLRHILHRRTPDLFREIEGKLVIDIAPGVLNAFFRIQHYKHGLRSMEAIVDMSKLAGKNAYESQSLPSKHQLDLQVDAEEFLSLVKAN
ncbi:MAG: toll/interleukin-1 receptor domain-containing protein [Desulfomonile tiedjei]|uniref:Toll/interleukin-1 receptor domain-containing protein n=1 Tax=Desulfomonile tiedjei TaxID=2358 RepID=A0A9D6Z5F3_9BACT|nr:toll/interleukin-1 receptor domain-containing protein [Desulfomonile tiedjei]